MKLNIIHNQDCLVGLKELPDNSIDCCVTSPPYFGLRDYGTKEQIGMEQTPDEFVDKLVQVFSEVKRVLKPEGTLWLNLGDSYNGSGKAGNNPEYQKRHTAFGGVLDKGYHGKPVNVVGLKPKDLIGIPWMVAKALRGPWYTGRIKEEKDRVWMAAMVDAEGCICGHEYINNDKVKTNLYISITNSNTAIIEKCDAVFPQQVRHIYLKGGKKNVDVYRWDVEQMEVKQQFIKEIYPHLVGKRKQAVLAYNFLQYQKELLSKKRGYLSSQQEKRSWIIQSLSKLNGGENIDLPSWLVEPPSLYEPGFYLRQDIIWHKPNPMPESVTDRCTKSHEYIFLLTKSHKYYYDINAIRTPVKDSTVQRMMQQIENQKGSERVPGKTNGTMKAVGPGRTPRPGLDTKGGNQASELGIKAYSHRGTGDKKLTGHSGNFDSDGNLIGDGMANKKSVWTVTTKPFKEAHFAVFPEELIYDCIKAGCPLGGVVLDPFMGSGTTALVSRKLNRNFIGFELNQEYISIANKRLYKELGMFI